MESLEDRVYKNELDIKDLRNDIDNNSKEDRAFRKYVSKEITGIKSSIDSLVAWQKRQTVVGIVFKTIILILVPDVAKVILDLLSKIV